MTSTSNLESLTRIEKLGELLVRFNALKLSQLTLLIEEQRNNPDLKLGELAIQKGFITKEQLVKFLDYQIKEGKVVDESLKELGVMTNDEKWDRLSQHERLGELLIKRNIIKLSQLTDSMDELIHHPGKHLGQLLVEKGLIDESELKEVLKWQEEKNEALKEIVNEVKSHNPTA